MGCRGCLIADAHVRAAVVVEVNEVPYAFTGCIDIAVQWLTVEFLGLYDAVDAFCYAVVGRLVVLSHADVYLMAFEFPYVGVAAVLYAAVRVVDQAAQVTATGLLYGLPQGLKCVLRLKGWREAPSYDLV